jgi:hypothetical protein
VLHRTHNSPRTHVPHVFALDLGWAGQHEWSWSAQIRRSSNGSRQMAQAFPCPSSNSLNRSSVIPSLMNL